MTAAKEREAPSAPASTSAYRGLSSLIERRRDELAEIEKLASQRQRIETRRIMLTVIGGMGIAGWAAGLKDVFTQDLPGVAAGLGTTGLWTLVSVVVAYFAVRTRYPSVRAAELEGTQSESATLSALEASQARLRAAMPPLHLRTLSVGPALAAGVLWMSTGLQLLIATPLVLYLRDVLPPSMFVVPEDNWDAYERALSQHFALYQDLSHGLGTMPLVPIVVAVVSFLQILRGKDHAARKGLARQWWPAVVVAAVASSALAFGMGSLALPALALGCTLATIAMVYWGIGRLARGDAEERRNAEGLPPQASAEAEAQEVRRRVSAHLAEEPEAQDAVEAAEEPEVAQEARAWLPLA
jgi:hypothetical protein